MYFLDHIDVRYKDMTELLLCTPSIEILRLKDERLLRKQTFYPIYLLHLLLRLPRSLISYFLLYCPTNAQTQFSISSEGETFTLTYFLDGNFWSQLFSMVPVVKVPFSKILTIAEVMRNNCHNILLVEPMDENNGTCICKGGSSDTCWTLYFMFYGHE